MLFILTIAKRGTMQISIPKLAKNRIFKKTNSSPKNLILPASTKVTIELDCVLYF